MPGRKNDNNRNNRRDYDDSYEYMQRSSGNRSGNGRQDNRFQDVSSYSSQDEYNSRRKNKKGSTVVKSVAAIVCSLLIIAGAALIFLSTYVFKDLTTQSMPVDPVELGINSSVVSDDKIKNIALFGLDARNESFEGRSDAIMIVSLDSRHNKIKLTSILRDSLVDIEGNGKDR